MHSSDRTVLTYEARAENVPRARSALARLGEELGIEEPGLDDLKTIVTEATTNVVRHAYPDTDGEFEIEAFTEEGELAIVVRDSGAGVRPTPQIEKDATLRIGLGLISQLASYFEIGSAPGGGTVVRAHVPLA